MNEHTFPVWPGWETVRLIGRGSFGAVYEIRRDVFGTVERAALKLISIPQSDAEVKELRGEGLDDLSITESFREQAREIVNEYMLMRRLNDCPNVVSCDDVRYVQHEGDFGWDILIKMELLTPLFDRLGAERPLPEQEVIRLGRDLCRALVHCGKYNIVHRDIKPQNIFVSDSGLYKLGDFGIARAKTGSSTGTARIGTYDYMAPEVYYGEHYGAGADLYSLGIVLYWLLNRRRCPFQPLDKVRLSLAEKEEARRRRLDGETIPAPADGSEELRRIVLKACAYDPKERYKSAEEMLRDLERLAQDPSAMQADKDLFSAPPVLYGPPPLMESRKADRTQNEREKTVFGSAKTYGQRPPASPAEDATVATVGEPNRNYPTPTPPEEGGTVSVHTPVQHPGPSPAQKKKKAAPVALLALLVLALVIGGVFLAMNRPSPSPAVTPTPEATGEPTAEPTAEPTPEPTAEPTAEPEIWAEPQYEWAADHSTATATRPCENYPEKTVVETVQTSAAVLREPSCEENGTTRYTATFTNDCFEEQTEDADDLPALGHDWRDATYTAPKTCARCGATVGEPLKKIIRVAMVTDYGDVTDLSYNQTTYEAGKAFCEANGLDFTYYKPAADSDEDRIAMIEKAIKDGYNVIIMPGYAFAPAIAATAPNHSDVRFIALDVSSFDLEYAGLEKLPANVYSSVYQTELGGFMAGYAAVKMGYTRLGFLGGMAIPEVTRYGYGFVQGADTAAAEIGADVTINYAYANQFYGDATITAEMNRWYAQGTQIVFACGGGLYTSVGEAAAKHGGKVIGLDTDQAPVIDGMYGSGITVTSAMKGLGATVNHQLAAIFEGSFTGGMTENLGLISGDPELNYIQLPMESTQFSSSFTISDYAAMVSALYEGKYLVSNDYTVDVSSLAGTVTVNDLGNLK